MRYLKNGDYDMTKFTKRQKEILRMLVQEYLDDLIRANAGNSSIDQALLLKKALK